MTTEKESFKKGARAKAMDYLARRDHSEKELAEKLSKHFEAHEIEDALSEMRQRGWILPPEELAEKAAKACTNAKRATSIFSIFYVKKACQKWRKTRIWSWKKP